MDGSIAFAQWRQCVLPWGHTGTTWQIRLNLCILWPTQVHNPNSKSIGSAVFAQLKAEGAYTLQWAPYPPELPLPTGGSGPHLTHDALGPCEPISQTACRSVQPCLHRSPECPYTLQWFAHFPFKIAPSQGDLNPIKYMVPWAHLSPEPKRQLDQQPFCRAH